MLWRPKRLHRDNTPHVAESLKARWPGETGRSSGPKRHPSEASCLIEEHHDIGFWQHRNGCLGRIGMYLRNSGTWTFANVSIFQEIFFARHVFGSGGWLPLSQLRGVCNRSKARKLALSTRTPLGENFTFCLPAPDIGVYPAELVVRSCSRSEKLGTCIRVRVY